MTPAHSWAHLRSPAHTCLAKISGCKSGVRGACRMGLPAAGGPLGRYGRLEHLWRRVLAQSLSRARADGCQLPVPLGGQSQWLTPTLGALPRRQALAISRYRITSGFHSWPFEFFQRQKGKHFLEANLFLFFGNHFPLCSKEGSVIKERTSVEDYMKRIIKQKPHIISHLEGKLSSVCLFPIFEGGSVKGEPELLGLINKDSNQTHRPLF